MVSSAWPTSAGGMVSPSALAVLRLIAREYRAGCSKGRSPGFAPLRILSTYVAARRKLSTRFAPYLMRPPASANPWLLLTEGSRCLSAWSAMARPSCTKNPSARTGGMDMLPGHHGELVLDLARRARFRQHHVNPGDRRLQQLEVLRAEIGRGEGQAGNVAARPCEAGHETVAHRVVHVDDYDGNGRGGMLRRAGGYRPSSQDDVDF